MWQPIVYRYVAVFQLHNLTDSVHETHQKVICLLVYVYLIFDI